MELSIETGRKDHLSKVNLASSDTVRLVFADGFSATIPLEEIGIAADHFAMRTLRVATSKSAIEIESTYGDVGTVSLDAASLRAQVDAEYYADMQQAYAAKRGSIDELKALAEIHAKSGS